MPDRVLHGQHVHDQKRSSLRDGRRRVCHVRYEQGGWLRRERGLPVWLQRRLRGGPAMRWRYMHL